PSTVNAVSTVRSRASLLSRTIANAPVGSCDLPVARRALPVELNRRPATRDGQPRSPRGDRPRQRPDDPRDDQLLDDLFADRALASERFEVGLLGARPPVLADREVKADL